MSEAHTYRVYANAHFTVAQCRDCAVPGCLIVATRDRVTRLAELGAEATAALGPTLQRAVAAVEQVLAPARVYCAQFGEAQPQLHFHVFPRTAEVTRDYRAERPAEAALIHGPLLLDWARERYRCTHANPAMLACIADLRRLLTNVR